MANINPITNNLNSRAAQFEAETGGDPLGSRARMSAKAKEAKLVNLIIKWDEEKHHNMMDKKRWDVLSTAGKESRNAAASIANA